MMRSKKFKPEKDTGGIIMKIRINLTTDELTKIQNARDARAKAQEELDAFSKRALENAVPWTISLNDEDVAAYRAAREEGRRLAEKIESLSKELESVIKSRDEHQAHEQDLKAEVSKLQSENEREKLFIRMIAMAIYPEASEKTPIEIMFDIAESNNFAMSKTGGPNNASYLSTLYEAWCSGDDSVLQNPEIKPEYPLPQVQVTE
jgi:chromosome segregation ATPase